MSNSSSTSSSTSNSSPPPSSVESIGAALDDLAAAFAAVHRGQPAMLWLRETLAGLRASEDPTSGNTLRIALARASRYLGREPQQLDPERLTSLPSSARASLVSPPWRPIDFGRAALVHAALTRALVTVDVERGAQAFSELLRVSGLDEQQSLLRMLPLLPIPPSTPVLLEAALNASRTNATPVFAALALDNPYPAAEFPELHFNQLVLKAVFLALPVARIHGLEARATPELARMVQGYASERAAAGRNIPEGVDTIVTLVSSLQPHPIS